MSVRDEPPAVRAQISSSVGMLREACRGGWIVSERSVGCRIARQSRPRSVSRTDHDLCSMLSPKYLELRVYIEFQCSQICIAAFFA